MTRFPSNFFDNRWPQFEHQMDRSMIDVGAIPARLLGFQECPDCGELAHTIRYRGEVRYIVAGAKKWSWHQCPNPVEDQGWDDDQASDDPQGSSNRGNL